MTIFGVDVSYFQKGFDFSAARSRGIEFAIARTNDGTFKDVCYREHINAAVSSGMITAAYAYVRNPSEGTTIRQQADTTLQVMGDLTRPLWLDCETAAGLDVSHIREYKKYIEEAGVRVIGIYSYVPYWENRISPSEPDMTEFGKLWVAAYPSSARSDFRSLYPGDNHHQWNYPLGNRKPDMWQYASTALMPYETDVNAFRGTTKDLSELFYGEVKSDSIDLMAEIRLKSLIDNDKTFTPLEMVQLIDAATWETRQLIVALCKKNGVDANEILKEAKVNG